jgi:hypothetical protein
MSFECNSKTRAPKYTNIAHRESEGGREKANIVNSTRRNRRREE